MNNFEDPEIYSIYRYYINDYLKNLNKLPLNNQLLECSDFNVLILDFCGISPKFLRLFEGCDIFLIENQNENVLELCNKYDIVYFLTYQLQQITINWPAIKIVCFRNRITETILNC